MKKEESCMECKDNVKAKKESIDASAEIEYMDDKFALSVSSSNIKTSKKTFNELFKRVLSAQKRRGGSNSVYIG